MILIKWIRVFVMSLFASCFYMTLLIVLVWELQKTPLSLVSIIILSVFAPAFVTLWGLDSLDWSWLK